MSHFSKKEFACHCGCGYDDIHKQVVTFLEVVRNIIGQPIMVNSGCRCPSHNKAVGGKPHSYHLAGMAADVRTDWSKTTKKRFAFVLSCYFNGLIEYDDFFHIDVRGYRFHQLKGGKDLVQDEGFPTDGGPESVQPIAQG